MLTPFRWYRASQCQLFEDAFDEYKGYYDGSRKASNKVRHRRDDVGDVCASPRICIMVQ